MAAWKECVYCGCLIEPAEQDSAAAVRWSGIVHKACAERAGDELIHWAHTDRLDAWLEAWALDPRNRMGAQE